MTIINGVSYRVFKDHLFKITTIIASFLLLVPLILILFYIIKNGISTINWEFIINMPKPVGESGGGIANAIVGTFMLLGIASLCAIPLGILAGIFLYDYKSNVLTWWTRFSVEVLQGVPSIVIGILVYTWIVIPNGSFSALSGGIALGIMMLPIIVKSTEETLNLIPHHLKEASLALGVPYYKTLLKVIVPCAMSGIVTGILIGIARIVGETAPLLFTAFGNQFINYNILKPVNSLPLMIFNYAASPYEDWHKIAWGASFFLVAVVFILNVITKLVIRRWKVQF